jgi:heterodisulfide reductase subunit A-like polyferredoxin
MTTFSPPQDIFAARARHVISEHHKKYEDALNEMQGPLLRHLPDVPEVSEALPVCIIGAGAAGLYTGLILDSLGIPYQILEANPNLYGGRIFTKNFYSTNKNNYDYYVCDKFLLDFSFNSLHQ